MNLNLIGVDDLHPTELGYSAIADVFYQAVVRAFEDPGTSAADPLSRMPQDPQPATATVRSYWNTRIHDLEMTTQPVGSPKFFEELDEYRFDKLAYLPQVIDFNGYRGKRLVEVGCGVGTDLVRFARGGARVIGVDLARKPPSVLRRPNLAASGQAGDDARRRRRRPAAPRVERSIVFYAHGVLQYAAEPRAHHRRSAAASSCRAARPSSWSTTACRG